MNIVRSFDDTEALSEWDLTSSDTVYIFNVNGKEYRYSCGAYAMWLEESDNHYSIFEALGVSAAARFIDTNFYRIENSHLEAEEKGISVYFPESKRSLLDNVVGFRKMLEWLYGLVKQHNIPKGFASCPVAGGIILPSLTGNSLPNIRLF